MPRVESPRIYQGNFQKLLNEKKSIIPYYTPEWDISDEKDAGFALLKIFTHMHEDIINRLNRVPDKNFAAFLDMLGVKLIPAQPAKVPVTFYLSEGMPGGIFVPARTQAAAGETDKHGTLIFETVKSFYAVNTAIEEIYFVDPENDAIFGYSDDFRNKRTFNIFKGENDKNVQRHILYLGHNELFKFKKPAVITLQFILHTGNVDDLTWKYWGKNDTTPENFDVKKSKTGNYVTVTLASDGEIKEKEVNGKKSHWIECISQDIFDAPVIEKFQILNVSPTERQTIKPDIGYYNNIPIGVTGKIYPFGKQPELSDTFYIASKEAFSKKNAIITLKFTRSEFAANADIVPTNVKLSWQYWNGTSWQPLIIEVNDNTIDNFRLSDTQNASGVYEGHIRFNRPENLKETEINGKKNFWICVRLAEGGYFSTGKFHPPWVESVDVEYYFPPNKPDIGFYNNIPVDVTGKVYPLGKQPRLFDTFYIASREAFSKKKAITEVKFTRSLSDVDADIVPTNVSLSWEYWNGSLWQPLVIEANHNTIEDFRLRITTSGIYEGHIKFNCPEDLKETDVNGEKNFWIRVRLVSGNYGRDEFTKVGDLYIIDPKFHPPWIDSIGIKYSLASGEPADLQSCLAFNNLEYRDFTKENAEDTRFKPFIPLPENKPTIYLGLSKAFRKGNISIFFSLEDKEYPADARPKIEWTYWGTASNLLKDMSDLGEVNMASLEGLSVGNELLFEESLILPDGSREKDKSMPFISGTAKVRSISEIDRKITLEGELDYKYTKSAVIFKRTNLEVTDNTEHLTRSGTLEFIGQSGHSRTRKFGKESFWLMGTLVRSYTLFEPLIRSIYPNTVWAEQIETIKDEILGSSDGDKKKNFNFTRSPVISPEIWVMEGKIISGTDEERPAVEDIRELKDETGKVKETWVRWKVVDDFLDSAPGSRHCIVDNSMGIAQFGDGEHGMIPPIGKNNIKSNYKSGGGVKGNVMKNEISILKNPVAGVDRVTNPLPAEGGADTELLDEVFERGPHLIKHRSRAVTIEDFERLASEASNYIARTRCITEGNKLRVIIIPKGEEDRPVPSTGLKKIVKDYLIERSLNSINKYNLDMSNPVYREVKVTVEVIPVSIDRAVPLEMEISKRLREYLHPLTGGNEKTGWEFGRGVRISDIYALLEGMDGVDHVENLKLNEDSYLFCWDDIPDSESDRDRLLKFLKYNFNINWTDNASINELGANISVSSKDTQAEIRITLDENKGVAILNISTERAYDLLLKIESGRRNIYSKDLYIENDEIVCSGDHRIMMQIGGQNGAA